MVNFGHKAYGPKYITKTITILNNGQVVYSLYKKTKRNVDILSVLKYEITRLNADSSKEVLTQINYAEFEHNIFNVQGKKIKIEVINSNVVNWDEWLVVPE